MKRRTARILYFLGNLPAKIADFIFDDGCGLFLIIDAIEEKFSQADKIIEWHYKADDDPPDPEEGQLSITSQGGELKLVEEIFPTDEEVTRSLNEVYEKKPLQQPWWCSIHKIQESGYLNVGCIVGKEPTPMEKLKGSIDTTMDYG